jgi:hypothetical protein
LSELAGSSRTHRRNRGINLNLENIVKRLFLLFACFVSMLGFCASVQAQEPERITFSQEELDQLLAPVALYPDTLLTQVLMAATYPMEAVQAARFARQNPGLGGEALVRALEEQPWDASVKALVEFPLVLDMMEDQLAWTQKLGDAFLAQQDAVMDTIQSLRARAQTAGYLESSSRQRVLMQDSSVVIESPTPELLYVPYYDPTVVYGRWWWPNRQPMVWAPPPGRRGHYSGNAVGGAIGFGIGVAIIGTLFHEARPNWRGRNIVLDRENRGPGSVWSHNPEHRRGTAYRDTATRNRYRAFDPNSNRREPFRGRVAPIEPHRPNSGMPHAQPGTHPRSDTPQQQPFILRPDSGRNPSRRLPIDPFNPHGSASVIHSQSERGRGSRETSRFNPVTPNPSAHRTESRPVARPAFNPVTSNPGAHRTESRPAPRSAAGDDRKKRH